MTCSVSYNGTKLGEKTFTVHVKDNEGRIRNNKVTQASLKSSNTFSIKNMFYSLF